MKLQRRISVKTRYGWVSLHDSNINRTDCSWLRQVRKHHHVWRERKHGQHSSEACCGDWLSAHTRSRLTRKIMLLCLLRYHRSPFFFQNENLVLYVKKKNFNATCWFLERIVEGRRYIWMIMGRISTILAQGSWFLVVLIGETCFSFFS